MLSTIYIYFWMHVTGNSPSIECSSYPVPVAKQEESSRRSNMGVARTGTCHRRRGIREEPTVNSFDRKRFWCIFMIYRTFLGTVERGYNSQWHHSPKIVYARFRKAAFRSSWGTDAMLHLLFHTGNDTVTSS